MKKVNHLTTCIELDGNIMYSDGHVDGSEACSSYADGKCLENPEKYCDCCASEYGYGHCWEEF